VSWRKQQQKTRLATFEICARMTCRVDTYEETTALNVAAAFGMWSVFEEEENENILHMVGNIWQPIQREEIAP
jgi:hypothetical protein